MLARGKLTADEQLSEDLAEFYDDPLGYVMYCFPWDDDPSISIVMLAEGVEEFLSDDDRVRQKEYRDRFPGCTHGPDLWACDFLDDWGREIAERGFDGRHAVDPIQFATVSGHGIGKSCLTAWIIKFIMDTRPYSKGTVTAGTADQLKSKTWAELGKWHKRSLTEHWFKFSTGRGSMALRRITDPDEWFCTAQTCKEENSEAFAGQHAVNSTSFYIFDEASQIVPKIFEVRDGGLTDGEPMVFDFGNGTRNSGRFHSHCVGKLKHRYNVRSIDSRSVAITNPKLLQQYIDDHGIDSDYVKVRVRGMFPSMGDIQFIPTADVEEAQQRELPVDKTAPLVIGVDVARHGVNESVIYPRIGDDARSFAPSPGKGRYRGLDTVQLTGKIIEKIREFRSMGVEYGGVFIDGGGIGGGVIDQLRHAGYKRIHEVKFGGAAQDSKTYRFCVGEIWGRMKEHLHTRLCLPDDKTDTGLSLKDNLTAREFGYTLVGDKIHLETKEDYGARMGDDANLDIPDALACTYWLEVEPQEVPHGKQTAGVTVLHEYDPYETE